MSPALAAATSEVHDTSAVAQSEDRKPSHVDEVGCRFTVMGTLKVTNCKRDYGLLLVV